MSIDPIGSIDAGSTSVISLQQIYEVDPAERRTAALRQQDDFSVLTAGDREFLSAVFGPQTIGTAPVTAALEAEFQNQALDAALDQARDLNRLQDEALEQAQQLNQAREDALQQAQIEDQNAVSQFISDLIADRRDGSLPSGTEITSSYVQARFDAYIDRNDVVANPQYDQLRINAEAYFSTRVQGSAIDLQA